MYTLQTNAIRFHELLDTLPPPKTGPLPPTPKNLKTAVGMAAIPCARPNLKTFIGCTVHRCRKHACYVSYIYILTSLWTSPLFEPHLYPNCNPHSNPSYTSMSHPTPPFAPTIPDLNSQTYYCGHTLLSFANIRNISLVINITTIPRTPGALACFVLSHPLLHIFSGTRNPEIL